MVLVLVLYTSFFVPWQLSFQLDRSTGNKVFDLLVDLVFLADLTFSFCTAYVLPTGEEVVSPRVIRWHYLKTWFILDFVSAIPFEVINMISGAGSMAALNLLKAPRLLRLGKIARMLDQMSGASYIRIVKLLVAFFILAHWIACGWFYLGRYQKYGNEWTGSNWLVRNNMCQSYLDGGNPYEINHIQHCVPRNHEDWLEVGNEWPIDGINAADSALDVDRSNPGLAKTNKVLSDADFRSQYWTSLYWAFTTLTTVGFGDITPATNGEKMYTMVVMVLGAVIYATIFGNVALVIQSLDHAYSRARARTEVVKNLGYHYDLEPATVKKLHHYVEMQMLNNMEFREVLEDLPQSVQWAVAQEMHTDLLKRMEFRAPGIFRRLDFAVAMIQRSSPKAVLEGDTVHVVNAMHSKEICFINQGEVSLSLMPEKGGVDGSIRETLILAPGNFIAGFSGQDFPGRELMQSLNISFEAKATTFTDLFSLKGLDYIDVEKEYYREFTKLRRHFWLKIGKLRGDLESVLTNTGVIPTEGPRQGDKNGEAGEEKKNGDGVGGTGLTSHKLNEHNKKEGGLGLARVGSNTGLSDMASQEVMEVGREVMEIKYKISDMEAKLDTILAKLGSLRPGTPEAWEAKVTEADS